MNDTHETVGGSWNRFESGGESICDELMLVADFSVTRTDVVKVFGEERVAFAETHEWFVLRSSMPIYVWYKDGYLEKQYKVS